MKFLCMLFTVLVILFLPSIGSAEDLIQNNVVILENATPQQCSQAARGVAGPENQVTYTEAGEYTGTSGPGVRSCVNCAVDSKTNNCICKTCYSYYN